MWRGSKPFDVFDTLASKERHGHWGEPGMQKEQRKGKGEDEKQRGVGDEGARGITYPYLGHGSKRTT